ncbi:MAG: hypothetical protein H3C35_05330 [Bacteroidetes bacterium]|nr:hypothetical protein [Bacteroidota bacterium]
MAQITVNEVLETFKGLSLPEKEFAVELLEKQIVAEKRKALVSRVKEARKNYKSGNVKKGTVKDLLKDLNSD